MASYSQLINIFFNLGGNSGFWVQAIALYPQQIGDRNSTPQFLRSPIQQNVEVRGEGEGGKFP